jgi:hypothetical protein
MGIFMATLEDARFALGLAAWVEPLRGLRGAWVAYRVKNSS